MGTVGRKQENEDVEERGVNPPSDSTRATRPLDLALGTQPVQGRMEGKGLLRLVVEEARLGGPALLWK